MSDTPAVAGSPLFSIRQTVETLATDDDTIDLRVPRFEGQLDVVVRFNRLPQRQFNRLITPSSSVKKADRHGWQYNANIDVLAAACAGIHVVHDGELYAFNDADPTGTAPTFASYDVLAENLGEPINDKRAAVQALYGHDADVLATAMNYVTALGYEERDLTVELDTIRGK